MTRADVKIDPVLLERLSAAVDAFKAMPPDAKKAMMDAQRESAVRAEFIMGDDATEARWRRAIADNDAEEISRLSAGLLVPPGLPCFQKIAYNHGAAAMVPHAGKALGAQ